MRLSRSDASGPKALVSRVATAVIAGKRAWLQWWKQEHYAHQSAPPKVKSLKTSLQTLYTAGLPTHLKQLAEAVLPAPSLSGRVQFRQEIMRRYQGSCAATAYALVVLVREQPDYSVDLLGHSTAFQSLLTHFIVVEVLRAAVGNEQVHEELLAQAMPLCEDMREYRQWSREQLRSGLDKLSQNLVALSFFAKGSAVAHTYTLIFQEPKSEYWLVDTNRLQGMWRYDSKQELLDAFFGHLESFNPWAFQAELLTESFEI